MPPRSPLTGATTERTITFMRYSLLILCLLFSVGAVFAQDEPQQSLPGVFDGQPGEPRVFVTMVPLSLRGYVAGLPDDHRPINICVVDPDPGVKYIAVVNREAQTLPASHCVTFAIPTYDAEGRENAPDYIAVFPVR